MTRPPLHEIPLAEVSFEPGNVIVTVSENQWGPIQQEAYRRGHTILELDQFERPVRAYRLCTCEICRATLN